MKTDEQQRARELRATGCSIKEIETHLGVARSSVSRWVRDVDLTGDQQLALAARSGYGRLRGAESIARSARDVRARHQQVGRRRVREEDPSYLAGCLLYWAEGTKNRSTVALSNSDVDLLRLFAGFLRLHFDVRDEQMRLHCHLFVDHVMRQQEIEQHWLVALDLPATCLRKTIVNVYSKYSTKKRKNKLPYGTAKLAVHSTAIAQTIFGSIQEYGGFERPEWLD